MRISVAALDGRVASLEVAADDPVRIFPLFAMENLCQRVVFLRQIENLKALVEVEVRCALC
jgi:hypothetical protein